MTLFIPISIKIIRRLLSRHAKYDYHLNQFSQNFNLCGQRPYTYIPNFIKTRQEAYTPILDDGRKTDVVSMKSVIFVFLKNFGNLETPNLITAAGRGIRRV
jgi:hypothetical protein